MTDEEMVASYEREIVAARGILPAGYRDDVWVMQIAKLHDVWRRIVRLGHNSSH